MFRKRCCVNPSDNENFSAENIRLVPGSFRRHWGAIFSVHNEGNNTTPRSGEESEIYKRFREELEDYATITH